MSSYTPGTTGIRKTLVTVVSECNHLVTGEVGEFWEDRSDRNHTT